MNVSFLIRFILILYHTAITTPKISYDYYKKWFVVAQNSSGQLFFDITPLAPRIFICKTYNDSVLPSIFHDQPLYVVPDHLETTTPGTLARIVSANTLRVDTKDHQEVEKASSAKHNTELASLDPPTHAALKVRPPSQETQPKKFPEDYGQNIFYHASKVAEMMELLGNQRSAPNLTAPNIHEGKKFNVSQVSNDSIVYAKDEVSLTKESSHLHHIRLKRLCA